jgi:hypothetical protein
LDELHGGKLKWSKMSVTKNNSKVLLIDPKPNLLIKGKKRKSEILKTN